MLPGQGPPQRWQRPALHAPSRRPDLIWMRAGAIRSGLWPLSCEGTRGPTVRPGRASPFFGRRRLEHTWACPALTETMPIDIRELRVDQGGDPERWREFQRKRFKDPELVDRVLALDNVSAPSEFLRCLRKGQMHVVWRGRRSRTCSPRASVLTRRRPSRCVLPRVPPARAFAAVSRACRNRARWLRGFAMPRRTSTPSRRT